MFFLIFYEILLISPVIYMKNDIPFHSRLQSKSILFESAFEDVECAGKNTFVNRLGKCECLSKFPYGNPDSETGCWGCSPPCDSNAECFSSNQCRCLPGFLGDGVDLCEKPIPELLFVEPLNDSINGGNDIFFTIKSPPEYNITQAFCRFGPISVPATFSNTSLFICKSPKNKPGNFKVAASFDSSKWSTENIIFVYYDTGINTFSYTISFVLILMISMILIVLLWYYNKRQEPYDQAEEMLPLNKWHMNQEQVVAVEEKTFWDFLVNIFISS
ncbi:hypothetical protein TRFO_21106 [Tritrichomonas foetus]|uniref:EGF-like domain-containing protein n=1 Tax=Tritrichomonas foetus TaxID=1144522 RepID=A0A1J4KF75_9EUKA|nr:hypothetical protein TRFO_21106 [Tritrichomonas foetus]|eukprot:OHT09827.1 hypothetical protein TRFO_21106 [Tritrichomonas foetus]